MYKRETCFKMRNKAKLENNYYNSRLFILFIYLDYFYYPELCLLLPWKKHSCSSLVKLPAELCTWTSHLTYCCTEVSVFISTFFFEWPYLYKIIASVIWYIPGEIDTISGCDFLCFKSIPTKKPSRN